MVNFMLCEFCLKKQMEWKLPQKQNRTELINCIITTVASARISREPNPSWQSSPCGSEERGKENHLFENTELTLSLSSPQGPMASLCPQDYVPSSHKALDRDLPASVAKSHFRASARAAPSTWSALLTPILGVSSPGDRRDRVRWGRGRWTVRKPVTVTGV